MNSIPDKRRHLYFRKKGINVRSEDMDGKGTYLNTINCITDIFYLIFHLTFTKQMKLHFWTIGKAHEAYVKEGIEVFTKRIRHYYPVEWQILPVPKQSGMLSESDLKQKEGMMILEWLEPDDCLVALDENGKQMTSKELAGFIQHKSNQSIKRVIFLIGGAYGLDEKVLQRANVKWSLSKLVFPHQLVRLILAEQIYRACTILRNEKYHHA